MPLIGKALRVCMTLCIGLLIFLTLQYFSGAPTSINSSSLPKFSDLPSYQDAKSKLPKLSNLPTYEDAKKKLQQAKTGFQGAFGTKPKKQAPSKVIFPDLPESTRALGPGTGFPDGYAEQAHKLPDADHFLSHIRAVTKLPGISLKTAKASCDWQASQRVNFQYDANVDWAKEERTDGELDLRRRAWHKFVLKDMLPLGAYSSRWDGQGIVIVAGGAKGREQIKVILRALEKLGSHLPVEVHFWDQEMTQADQDDLRKLSNNIYFNNLKEDHNIVKTDYNAFVHNYQLKTVALINSRFAEILLLDSDNIPVIAPEGLFDSGVYKEYGTVFWPDIARTRPNNPIWTITNTKCRKDEFEQESGQMLVNKNKYFYHLQLAAWMNNAPQGEYYNKFLLGDKDMFRFAWHALKTEYGKPTKWIKTVGMLHGEMYCGHSFAQHHPDFWNSSVAFVHAGLTKLMAKDFLIWQQMQGGIFQAYQASPGDEDRTNIQSTGLKIDELKYWSGKPESIKFVQCNEMHEVPSKPLDEVLPGYDTLFKEIGGYTMLEDYFGGKEP